MVQLIKDRAGKYRIFDNEIYLYLNPDAASAVNSGAVASALDHYISSLDYEKRAGVPLLEEVFDSELYLFENDDVRDAVSRGHVSSALDHFVQWGHAEGRSGGPEVDADNPPELQFPGAVPPRHLRKRVHGVSQLRSFERVGKAIADNLKEVTAQYSASSEERPRVLDFGCGCARVLAYYQVGNIGDIVGADIDEEAISWCKNNLSEIAEFVVNGHEPPLPFENNSFDLIYSVSVMTHLPEKMQLRWLAELERIAKPNGLLLLTVRGIHGVHLTRWQKFRFGAKGFWYGGGRLTQGLPKFYKSAFHTEEYVRRTWSQFFDVVEFRSRGLIGDQDLVVCVKRP